MSSAGILYGGVTAAGALPAVSIVLNSTDAGYQDSWIADGDAGTIWQAADLTNAVRVVLDFGADVELSAVAITNHNAYSAIISTPYIQVAHSADNVSYTVVSGSAFDPLTEDGNYAASWTAATDRYWRVSFIGVASPDVYDTKLRVADIAFGAFLEIPEPTDFGFKALGLKHATREARLATGPCLGGTIVDHVANRVKLKIGPQAISDSDFFQNGTAAPSWDHFIRTWWSLGKSFTFVPIIPDNNSSAPFVYTCRAPPGTAKIKTPYLNSWRRKLEIEFDCLASEFAP